MIRRFRFRSFQRRSDALELDLVIELDGKKIRRRVKIPKEHTSPAALRAVARGKAPADHTPAVRWARAYVENLRAKHADPARARSKPRSPTFRSFAQRFIDEYSVMIRAKPATRKNYGSHLSIYLLPHLGTLRLDEINASEISKLQANERLKASTINNYCTTLRTMLNWAVELGLLSEAPRIRRLKVARDKRPQELWWDKEELDRLLRAAEETDVETYTFVLLGADAGLRVGEICTLRWEDIDFADGVLWVRRNLSNGEIVDTPKGSRLRTVPLSTRLANALRAHRHLAHECVLYRTLAGTPMHWTPHVATWRLARTCRKAGLEEAGPHKLRHTCGSRLGAQRFPQHEIARYLGHAKSSTTEIYLHTREETQREMASSELGSSEPVPNNWTTRSPSDFFQRLPQKLGFS